MNLYFIQIPAYYFNLHYKINNIKNIIYRNLEVSTVIVPLKYMVLMLLEGLKRND